jgi:hypothetical protein
MVRSKFIKDESFSASCVVLIGAAGEALIAISASATPGDQGSGESDGGNPAVKNVVIR